MKTREREFTNTAEDMDPAHELEQAVTEQGRRLLQASGQWIRRNPYLAIGIAAAVGCVIAACLRRDD